MCLNPTPAFGEELVLQERDGENVILVVACTISCGFNVGLQWDVTAEQANKTELWHLVQEQESGSLGRWATLT